MSEKHFDSCFLRRSVGWLYLYYIIIDIKSQVFILIYLAEFYYFRVFLETKDFKRHKKRQTFLICRRFY